MILSPSASFSGFCADTGWKVIFTMTALFCVYFASFAGERSSVSLLPNAPSRGRFYSCRTHSPPGLNDIRRASSLTNKPCVGPGEKPPRRCHNKSTGIEKALTSNTTYVLYKLRGVQRHKNTCTDYFGTGGSVYPRL